ncbi:GntR family transcriptional regulator [Verminephrobacter eiseniae]|uniref:GntR family transcriptional regulator n=1 Tax=Verminephrobacter eiseniae TaxID=364317 RepID=UPI002237301F|nr:GntR family transcriptional regulator [Verminephrobacter eiseniae]
MALRLDASRTPVREALLLLSVQGLVDVVPRTGIHVHKLRASELIAMMEEALDELEDVLTRLAARRIVASQRPMLQTALEGTARCAQANDIAGYEDANATRHEVMKSSTLPAETPSFLSDDLR